MLFDGGAWSDRFTQQLGMTLEVPAGIQLASVDGPVRVAESDCPATGGASLMSMGDRLRGGGAPGSRWIVRMRGRRRLRRLLASACLAQSITHRSPESGTRKLLISCTSSTCRISSFPTGHTPLNGISLACFGRGTVV
jgi:hypothetical protein